MILYNVVRYESDRVHILNWLIGRTGSDLELPVLMNDRAYDALNNMLHGRIAAGAVRRAVEGGEEMLATYLKAINLSNLRKLEVDFLGCDACTTAVAKQLINALPSTLIDLKLTHCYALSDALPDTMANLVNLRRLELKGTQVTDVSVLSSLTSLRELDLRYTRVQADTSTLDNENLTVKFDDTQAIGCLCVVTPAPVLTKLRGSLANKSKVKRLLTQVRSHLSERSDQIGTVVLSGPNAHSFHKTIRRRARMLVWCGTGIGWDATAELDELVSIQTVRETVRKLSASERPRVLALFLKYCSSHVPKGFTELAACVLMVPVDVFAQNSADVLSKCINEFASYSALPNEAIKLSLERLQACFDLRDIVFSTHERRAACTLSFSPSEPEILAEGVHSTNLSEESLDQLDLQISPSDLALLPLMFRLPEQRVADLSGEAWLANSRGRAVALEKCWMCADSTGNWDFVYRIATKSDIADFNQELSSRVINRTLRKLFWIDFVNATDVVDIQEFLSEMSAKDDVCFVVTRDQDCPSEPLSLSLLTANYHDDLDVSTDTNEDNLQSCSVLHV